MNAMMYHHGAPSDYDEWAQISGDDSWAYKNFIQYFRKFEKYSPSSKHPLVDATHRSSQGLVTIGHNAYTSPLTKVFVEACHKVGIPTSLDVNTSLGTLGSTRIMAYVNSDGERVTTESAYLTPKILGRPNLTVVTGARATKLILDAGTAPRVVGVEFASSRYGKSLRAMAKKEVVLAAGAVHTPQLLMLSGIGPAEHLSSYDIPVHVDLPGVGSGLKDHLAIGSFFRDTSGQALGFLAPSNWWENIRLQAAKMRWFITGGGPLSSNIGEGAAFARTTDPSFLKEEKASNALPKDTTSGPQAPDVEFIFLNVGYSKHGAGPLPSGNIVTMLTVHLRPESEGTIRLASSSIFDAPIIDPKYLSAENDVKTFVRGLRLALEIMRENSFNGIIDSADTDPELDNFLHLESDETLAKVVRERVETLYHPCRTARMAPREEGGVVDGRLRVYGVQGLRVADASVFPEIVAGHTSAPCIAIGEKCADMIKEDIKAMH
jgi:choline dehydrogenase